MIHEYFFEVVNVLLCSPFMFENTENKQLIDGHSGVQSVCFRDDFAVKTVVGFLRYNSFENVAHVQAFYLYAILFVAD